MPAAAFSRMLNKLVTMPCGHGIKLTADEAVALQLWKADERKRRLKWVGEFGELLEDPTT